ncbi:transmembrane and coiled-coil domains protein 2 isoform X3 [Plodia interpunctella]|uniref:transmembrane and coiled-coil domains protein 2 isoform X3 n=1 Tax=Plodia interpunctella TaxID=58824 RepID=UPI0023683E12|nr:transmembrane and coiled-coil domains protein 2 isoform X3 [Plodia interpunctella]
MDSLQVAHAHSKGSSRSQSPSATDVSRDPAVLTDDVIRSRVQSQAHHVSQEPSSSSSSRHGDRVTHHVKSHSRDLGNSPLSANTTGNSTRDLEDSPQKKILIAPGEYSGPVYSPNVSYTLSSADEYGSPAYRGQDGDYSNQDESDGGNVTSSKALAAIAHLNTKIERTKDLIRLEQTIRDDNVNEYLNLAANADKQQLQRIKAVFEKKNQKSALCIAQLQKKLEGYNKRINNWQQHGTSGQAGHRQPSQVLRDMGQGLKNVGGNIRDGITGLGGSVMAAPREFAHLFSRSNRFGSADNISQLAAPPHAELRANLSSEGSRASEPGEGATRGSTLPRAATSPAPKFSSDASPSSSVTSEGAPYPTQTGSNNLSESFSIKPILNELRERKDDYERLADRLDALKNLSQEVSFLSNALQEERFKTERLEEQINDLTELHQNEVENLKQALTDVEEKVQYQSEERMRDIHEALDLCQTKISKLEQWMAGGGGGGGGAGGGVDAGAHAALPPRLLLVKLLNVALTLLQLALLLVATVAGVAMPFLRTRVRVLTTSLAVMVGVMVLKQWPEVTQLSEHLVRRLKEYLLDKHYDRYECKSLCG